MIKFNSILREELSDFLDLRKVSKSKSTYSHDKSLLQGFDEYLCSISCNDKNLTETQLNGWVHSLFGHSPTIANKIIVIRIFLNQLCSYGIHCYIPLIPKTQDNYIPYIFSDTELSSIFNCADNLKTSYKVQKNKLIHVELPMILRLMYGCGLRIGETLALKMEDVNLVEGVLTLKCTKGNKQRIVPMHSSLSIILDHYCMAMGIVGYPKSCLFPTRDILEPVTPQNARNNFDGILEQTQIFLPGRKKHQRGPCLHCLR
ncbi:MAG: tyrosine-type recombinase/integrase, partial [Peptostreptococcaceae bacterium]|nr:tyrosine-type recombinase/integrase [Peptostreptococcaceae bacterium]